MMGTSSTAKAHLNFCRNGCRQQRNGNRFCVAIRRHKLCGDEKKEVWRISVGLARNLYFVEKSPPHAKPPSS